MSTGYHTQLTHVWNFDIEIQAWFDVENQKAWVAAKFYESGEDLRFSYIANETTSGSVVIACALEKVAELMRVYQDAGAMHA